MYANVLKGQRCFLFSVFALAALISASCDFPHDPRGTLDKVQNGTMRVGIVNHDPWTRMEEGRASGVEVELLRDFAGEVETEIAFVQGTVPELLEAARLGEVDVVAGGFTSNSPGVRGRRSALQHIS
jgi:polar amino acid transport system substrate-binding protein